MENSKDTNLTGHSLKLSKSENVLQAEIVQRFRNNYCLKHHNPRYQIFSVPNGGTRNKIEAMTLKATGLLSGVSDLIVVLPNRILFLELKTETGQQSDSQVEFSCIISVLGFEYYVIRSIDEFKNIIYEHFQKGM